MEKRYLTATDLMNYHYCPRILYFVHTLKKPQFTTKKEYKGREKEGIFQSNAKRTKVVKTYPKLPKIFKVNLVSENLGIKTIADSIMIDKEKNEAYPIQAKFSFRPRAIYRGQKAQLSMEALLIEDQLGYKVPYGFIKFLRSGDLVKVNISDKDKLEVMSTFGKIFRIMSSETLPNRTKYRKRCQDCCFKKICW
jgi:CRISPR-associated exonuclease Cas4